MCQLSWWGARFWPCLQRFLRSTCMRHRPTLSLFSATCACSFRFCRDMHQRPLLPPPLPLHVPVAPSPSPNCFRGVCTQYHRPFLTFSSARACSSASARACCSAKCASASRSMFSACVASVEVCVAMSSNNPVASKTDILCRRSMWQALKARHFFQSGQWEGFGV